MTYEAKKLVEALREDAEWAHANEWEIPITLGDHLREAADMIEHLDEENAGLDILLTSAQSAAETWQRRAEAAERDLREADRLDCVHCIHNKPIDAKCEAYDFNCRTCKEPCACKSCEGNSNWKWRGLCAENGGCDHD